MSEPALEFYVQGLHLYRTAANHAAHDEDEQGTTWTLSPALSGAHDMAIMGDLTVRSARMFSGVQILAFLKLPWREEPLGDDDWELADQVLTAVADRVTHAMYDFAAMAMRAQVAGFAVSHTVPRSTPPYTLYLAGNADAAEPIIDEIAQDAE